MLEFFKSIFKSPRFLDKRRREIEIRRLLWIAVGAFIYSLFMNILIVPMGMYSGGFMGISQITRTLINRAFDLNTGSFDYAGIISMALNIPVFIIARKSVGKMYLFRTIVGLGLITVFLSIIPVPETKIIYDKLACAILGGAGCGLGGGLIMRSGGSGGGMDLVGAVIVHKKQNASISAVSNTVNVFIYGIMLFLFGPQMVIYSIIFSYMYPMVVDRVFAQNINVQVHIITNENCEEMQRDIFRQLGRGVTKWGAVGAYTGDNKEIIYILVNKYELSRLVTIVHEHDPHAMIVEDIGVRINGHFEKRLE